MKITEIWIGIIIPLIIGPIFIFLKTIYDNYMDHKYDRKREIFKEKQAKYLFLLKEFYWPIYINLLSTRIFSLYFFRFSRCI